MANPEVKCTGINATGKVCALKGQCLRYITDTNPQIPGETFTLDIAPFHGRPRHSRRQPFMYCGSFLREATQLHP